MIKEDWVLKDSKERWEWKESLDQQDSLAVQDLRYMILLNQLSQCIFHNRAPLDPLDILDLMGRRDQLVDLDHWYVTMLSW